MADTINPMREFKTVRELTAEELDVVSGGNPGDPPWTPTATWPRPPRPLQQ